MCRGGTYREVVALTLLELPLWGALVYLPVPVSLSDVSAAFHVSAGCLRRQGAGHQHGEQSPSEAFNIITPA